VKTLVAKPFLCPCLKIQRTRPRVSVVVNKAGVYTTTTKPGGENVRFRLDNLGPQPGSRKRAKRKGRGISAGQGASCGFGMRGQKSRSGPGIMRGFEGGQMPLYRRLPKLRGIAGGTIPFFSFMLLCWMMFKLVHLYIFYVLLILVSP
jgi:large subunit ribosomal protein L15